jgi:hypothetical protein
MRVRFAESRAGDIPGGILAPALVLVALTVSPVGAYGQSFEQLLSDLPENRWALVNLNRFDEVWTRPEQRPIPSAGDVQGRPLAIIAAWSPMAWDPNRRDLIFWGAGHANYAGNEVYRFRSSSRRWERASLPSAVTEVSDAHYEAVDGIFSAPIASHAYDNSEFLPIADRFVTFGGAAYNTGSYFEDTARTRRTGPYFWDPSAAHPNRVGGTDGSHSNQASYPNVTGGKMWENRDNLRAGSQTPGQYAGDRFSGFKNGGTAYAVENGKDVLYVCDFDLWKYTVHSPENASSDTYEKVGNDASGLGSGQGPGAYDPHRRVFLKLFGGNRTFVTWDLQNPGPTNPARRIIPLDASGTFNWTDLGNMGLDYDPIRQEFVLWAGNLELWRLLPPANVVSGTWILEPVAGLSGPGPVRAVKFTGVLGKWKYIPDYDVFLGITQPESGEVWVYKPQNWQPSVDFGSDLRAPVASISTPPPGSVLSGTVRVTAVATDDVEVAGLDLFVDGTAVATDFAPPYEFDWSTTDFLDGLVSLTVLARDPAGNEGSSREVVVRVDNNVAAPDVTPPEVTLLSPVDGSTVAGLVPLDASATDDRALARLTISVDGLTRCTGSTSPLSCSWDSAGASGSHTVTAIAEDASGNIGTDTATVTIFVESNADFTLQEGLNAYRGTTDTYLSSYFPNMNFGSSDTLLDYNRLQFYQSLVRFKIFASEGGPVPDGATIEWARLELYKYSYYDQFYRAHRLLQPWDEAQATWNQRLAGVPWSQGGANGLGTDIAVEADGEAAAGWEPQWLSIDVTEGVRRMSNGEPNDGWKLVPVSGNSNLRRFRSRETTTESFRRPRLLIKLSPN